MAKSWQLQEAKNRFSEVVNEAVERGPQIITRNGVETVVILSLADFRKLRQRTSTLVEFLMDSPLKGAGLDVERLRDLPREIDL
ncbi:MAG TPA: type II toxin-antitoxin system Phd/YefM family antitoxin [Thermoanaerobaculia bacterium]|nr:type II toxin-antitoxin system Phd/YefM family antitoxin [Thermoanaerobaculia bacterium]